MRHLLVLTLLAAAAYSAPLTNLGYTLPAQTGPTPPGIFPDITQYQSPDYFEGIWSNLVPIPWQGNFLGNGQYPSGSAAVFTTIDFTNLSAGYLPAGTWVHIVDVDQGFGDAVRLRAFGIDGQPLSTGTNINTFQFTPWLEQPEHLSGPNPAEFLPVNLPSADWSNGFYEFRGAPADTNLTLSMRTNTDIYRMEIQKALGTNGVFVSAPVPEPSTYALLGAGLAAFAALRRRRR
jgi:hypothetical protein